MVSACAVWPMRRMSALSREIAGNIIDGLIEEG
jgi:hypothetical protein